MNDQIDAPLVTQIKFLSERGYSIFSTSPGSKVCGSVNMINHATAIGARVT
jgi:hypothetical protein